MAEVIIVLIMFVVGLVLLTKGAGWLVDGSADFARYLRISPILVGLTVVSIGTSLPEFIVSFIAAFSGSTDISIGNIIGSNIANIGLVLGLSALIFPLIIKSTTLIYEFPYLVVSSFLFLVLSNNKYLFNKDTLSLDWYDGVIFLIIFALFLLYIYRFGKSQRDSALKEFRTEYKHKNPLWKNWFYIIIGIILLISGGKLFVQSASNIARIFGLSEAFIGLTIVAVGTSLPEFFTSVVAAWKKEPDIAVGNVVGSCIFNIVFVLGIVSVLRPIAVSGSLLFIDSIVMIVFVVLLLLFATIGKKVSRLEGGILFSLYLMYIIYLIISL